MSHPTNASDDVTPRSGRIRQVLDGVIDRRASGETVSDEQLITEHPELMPDLANALRDLRLVQVAQAKAAVDKSSGLHVRCPHCHNPIEIVEESSLSDVVCPSCGSQFSLTDDTERTFQAGSHEMEIGRASCRERV